jgi:AraC-like DNA-binding protein
MPEYYVEHENSSLSEYGIEFFLQNHSAKGFTTRAHIHPAIELIYVQKGEYSVSIDNDETKACAGDLLFFRANTIHSIQLISEFSGSYYVLKINPSLLFHIFTGSEQMKMTSPFLFKQRGERAFFKASEIPDRFKSIFEMMIASHKLSEPVFFSTERAYSALLLIEMLNSMLPIPTDITDVNEKNLALIHKCVDYINKNYATEITAEQCADEVHMSYSYFARLFRAVMGKTFKEYLVSVRLAKAKSILLSTSISVTNVAMACGYSSLSYFIAEYKKEFGKTPREERKLATKV